MFIGDYLHRLILPTFRYFLFTLNSGEKIKTLTLFSYLGDKALGFSNILLTIF